MSQDTQYYAEDTTEIAREADPASVRSSRPDELPIADRLDENLDETNPDETILARPEWGGVTMAAMAGSFDMSVPAAMLAANYTIFRNADLRGDGSLTDGTGTLETAFKTKFEGYDDDGKPKDDKDNLLDDLADKVRDERAERKREMEETFSEAQIDAMPWEGDPNEVWDLGGITASRKTLLAGAKAARANLKKLASKDNWTEDQLAHETRLVSDYERAIIENRPADAAKAKQQMQPDTQERIDQETRKAISANKDVSPELADVATNAATTTTGATDAGSDVLSRIAAADQKAMRSETKVALYVETQHGSGLTNPPAIELTEEFSAVASKPANLEPILKPAQVADAAPTPAPILNQSFSI